MSDELLPQPEELTRAETAFRKLQRAPRLYRVWAEKARAAWMLEHPQPKGNEKWR